MSNQPLLWAAESRSLPAVRMGDGCFSAWLHFDRPWEEKDRAGLVNLITQGFRAIFISGTLAHSVHEAIDYLVADVTVDLVLTTSRRSLDRRAAFEFSSIRCPGGLPTILLVSAYSDAVSKEISIIRKQLGLVAAEITTNADLGLAEYPG